MSLALAEALVAELTADTDLAALVGARIHPLVIPQDGQVPCITYQQISGHREYTMGSDPTLARPRIQFSCYALTYAAAKNVADKLIAALPVTQRTLGSGDNQVTGAAAFVEDDDDDYEIDTGYYRARVDFFIWHNI